VTGSAVNDDGHPEDPPEQFRYLQVDRPYGPRRTGFQVWEVCDRECHRVERVEHGGEPFWSCIDCDLMEPAAGGQKTLDGGVQYD